MTDKVTKHFRLGDSVQIERFYERSFSAVQQTAMKSITKSWIKEIEPDKQKKFPYSGGEKPPWWPEGCYYREPDHLKKPGMRGMNCIRVPANSEGQTDKSWLLPYFATPYRITSVSRARELTVLNELPSRRQI
jgi:hypothetical protein